MSECYVPDKREDSAASHSYSTTLALKTGCGINREPISRVLLGFFSGGRVTSNVSKTVLLIVLTFALIAIYLGLVGNARWGDSTAPEISLEQPFEQVGPTTPLVLHIQDSETGIRDVSVRIVHNMETFIVTEQSFPSDRWLSLSGGKEHEFTLNEIPYSNSDLPRRQGQAQLIVTARDYSWRNWFEGNGQRLEKEFTPAIYPASVGTPVATNHHRARRDRNRPLSSDPGSVHSRGSDW